jgi:signal transduction histidine kinase
MRKKKDDGQKLAWLALDLLPQAVLIAQPGGAVVFRNQEAARALPLGDHVSEVLRDGEGVSLDWASDMAALQQELAGLVHPNVSLAGAGDRRLLVDIHMRCLGPQESSSRPAKQDEPLVLVVVEDVSLRASAERRLAASERLTAQAKAAARMAHELNNPLDGVLRYVGLAQRLAEGQAGEHLAAAKDGLMRMAEIIRDMLDASAASRGYRQSLTQLLDEAVSAFAPRAEALGVRVECNLPTGQAGLVEGADTAVDARMFQVFCNVIKNALDAMPSGGVLAIRTRVSDGQCVLTFADTGCGLTAKQVRHIFEPFYTTKPAGQGIGLGLTISRETVTALGGEIVVAPGAKIGVVVTITLPTCLPAGRSAQAVPVGSEGD